MYVSQHNSYTQESTMAGVQKKLCYQVDCLIDFWSMPIRLDLAVNAFLGECAYAVSVIETMDL